MSADDKRNFLRLDAFLDGAFKVCSDGRQGIFRTGNVSRSGFKVMLNRYVETGNRLEMEVRRPGSIVPTFMTGKVVWIKDIQPDLPPGFEAGIEMEKIDPLERQIIMDYCFNIWYENKADKDRDDNIE